MPERRKFLLSWSAFIKVLKRLFLPIGYPSSVSSDYLEYQIWDTVQALASSITGAIAAQALLVGMGVGNADATVLAASLSWMMKSGSGMIGRIIFVGIMGSKLDSDCKRWRLMADILNDAAMALELLSPHVPNLFTPTICVAELLKSLVGVAGTATRAAIGQHQALDNNMADVAAKDGSQETFSNLLALVFNLCMVHYVTGNYVLQYIGFILLTMVHLYANYRAVSCLRFTTFNRTRFSIGVQAWLTQRLSTTCAVTFPSVDWVNSREPILLSPPSSTWLTVHLGCSLSDLPLTDQNHKKRLAKVFAHERFIVYCPDWRCPNQPNRRQKQLNIYVILHDDNEAEDQFLAMLFCELLVYASKRNDLHDPWTDLLQSQQTDDVISFSQSVLCLVHSLADELPQVIAKSDKPHWNLQCFQFSLDVW